MKTTPGAIPLRERRTLADEYREMQTVLPANVGEVQRVETKRAFYAGAQAMFILMTGGLDADKEPTDLDVFYIESLHQELRRFGNDMAEGKA